MSDRSDHGFFPFLAGVVVGATLAVLFAPRSGRETREELKRRAEELYERGRDEASRLYAEGKEIVKEKAHDLYERGRDKVTHLYAEGKEAVKGKAHEFYEKGKHAVEEGVEKLKKSRRDEAPADGE